MVARVAGIRRRPSTPCVFVCRSRQVRPSRVGVLPLASRRATALVRRAHPCASAAASAPSLSARRAELLQRPVPYHAGSCAGCGTGFARIGAGGRPPPPDERGREDVPAAGAASYAGRLWMPVPLNPDAFYQSFIVKAGDPRSGPYPWAQPALLALGELLHFPHIVPPVEVGFTVFFSGLCAREIRRRRPHRRHHEASWSLRAHSSR